MDYSNNAKWIICRVCLRNCTEDMHKIFAPSGPVEDLVGKIRECGGIPLDSCDHLPDSICRKCLLLLRVAHKFRTLCQRSHQQLLNVLLSSVEVETTLVKDETEDLTEKYEATCAQEKCSSDEIGYILENGDVEGTDTDAAVVEANEVDDSANRYMEIASQNEIEYLQDDMDTLLASDQSNVEGEQFSHETSAGCNGEFEQLRVENCAQLTGNETSDITETCVVQFDESRVTNEPVIAKRRKRKQAGDAKAVPVLANDRKRAKKPRKAKKAESQALLPAEDEETFICFQCGNFYTERSKYTVHMRMHKKEKPHECEICHKRFAQTPQLSRHMNSHTGVRPYKCKFCTSSFADPSTCIKHERIHTNERPYKCKSCNKAFSYSNVLKVHMMIHTGEKPFSCKHCGKKFSQLHHKKAHERTHISLENLNQGESGGGLYIIS